MRTEARVLVEAIVQDLYGKLDLLDTEIAIDQEEDVAIVPTLVAVQLSLRKTLRLAEGCLTSAEEKSPQT